MTLGQLDALGQAIYRKTRCTTIYSDIASFALYECGKLNLAPSTEEERWAWRESAESSDGSLSFDWIAKRRLAAVTPKPLDPRLPKMIAFMETISDCENRSSTQLAAEALAALDAE